MNGATRLGLCVALLGATTLMPQCSGGGCGGAGSAGHVSAEELGVAVPPAAASALGAYSKTQRTPINRAAAPVHARRDGGVPKRRRAITGDAGVPL
ncbi:MAG TPA: hypothetical protein VHO25_04080 [Polyangiaceae bacterium]|nr:hypothetical protein [Polyangiaceae bacterium]